MAIAWALRIRGQLAVAEQAAARAAATAATLDAAPLDYLVLSDGGGVQPCSAGLAGMLGLGAEDPADLDAILQALRSKDAELLAGAVKALREAGTAFETTPERADGGRVFEVTGNRTQVAEGGSRDVLWFKDVTASRRALAAPTAPVDPRLAAAWARTCQSESFSRHSRAVSLLGCGNSPRVRTPAMRTSRSGLSACGRT